LIGGERHDRLAHVLGRVVGKSMPRQGVMVTSVTPLRLTGIGPESAAADGDAEHRRLVFLEDVLE
jgi:hypothetical protein